MRLAPSFPLFLSALLVGMPAMAAPEKIHGDRIHGDKAACEPGSKDTAVLVTASGFKDRTGNLRVIIYRALESDYFVSGRYANRIDTPISKSGSMTVCAKLPGPGNYVVIAMHDGDGNGKFSIRDGFGFANNPKLPLGKPPLADVTTPVSGVQRYDIVLNYLQGLSIRPIEGTQNQAPSKFGRGGRR